MKDDEEFQEKTITGVEEQADCYILSFDSSCLSVPKADVVPRVGQTARLYGRGLGFSVRGVVVDGRAIYYRTKREQEDKEQQDREAYRQRQRDEFEEKRQQMDAAYRDLHPAFKARIDKFRNANPDFRWQFESYEMMCCVDAQSIAAKLRTPEAIEQFRNLAFEEQRKQVSISDGHSGNSFGAAVSLASAFAEDPKLVILMHGALTPLVGCVDYGCPHPYEAP